jgi:UDP-glucose 4-epimerase
MFPRTPYASAKAAADVLTLSYGNCWPDTVNYTIVRPFNNYGPRKLVLKNAGIIPTAIRLLSRGQPVELNSNGETRRDFVHVSDTVSAVIKILEQPEVTRNQVYQVATGVSITMKQVVQTIGELMGITPEIILTSPRVGDVDCLKGSGEKILADLGIKPEMSFEDGLRECISYYSETDPLQQ